MYVKIKSNRISDHNISCIVCLLYIGTAGFFFQHFTSNFESGYNTQVHVIHEKLRYLQFEFHLRYHISNEYKHREKKSKFYTLSINKDKIKYMYNYASEQLDF